MPRNGTHLTPEPGPLWPHRPSNEQEHTHGRNSLNDDINMCDDSAVSFFFFHLGLPLKHFLVAGHTQDVVVCGRGGEPLVQGGPGRRRCRRSAPSVRKKNRRRRLSWDDVIQQLYIHVFTVCTYYHTREVFRDIVVCVCVCFFFVLTPYYTWRFYSFLKKNTLLYTVIKKCRKRSFKKIITRRVFFF